MAPKRAASPRRGRDRPAKMTKAEVASPGRKQASKPAAKAMPWEKDMEEVIAALSQVSSLTPASREMAEAMTPHCLSTPRSERHEFQTSFAESLVKLFRGEEAARQAAVEAVEAEAAALRDEEAGAGGKLDEARGVASAAEGRKVEAAAAMKAAQQATEVARSGLTAACKAKEDVAAEVADLKGQMGKLEAAMVESWEPLVAGSFVGKEWRKREKAIVQVAQLLKGFDAAESLIQAVSASFKTKAESRGPFAQQSLEHGKAAFAKEISSIKEKLEATEAKPVDAEVAEAEGAVKAAEAKEAEAVDASIAAENNWAEAESAVVGLRDAQSAFGPRTDALATKLNAAKAALTEIGSFVAKIAELEQREKPEEPAEEEPAELEQQEEKPEEVAEVEAVDVEAAVPVEGEAQA